MGLIRGKETQKHRHTQGRRTCDSRDRDWDDVGASHGVPNIVHSHQKLGRGKRFFPRDYRGNTVLPTP